MMIMPVVTSLRPLLRRRRERCSRRSKGLAAGTGSARPCMPAQKSINKYAQKKCMPPQENVYTHVCAKEMYACTKSIYRYMYAQKKCMPPQENVYIHVCTKKNLCLRNNKCIHTCLHKKKCMPAHE